MQRRCVLAAMAVLLAGCADAPGPRPGQPGLLTASPGQPAAPASPRSYSFRAGTRSTLYIPASAPRDQPAPFLLLLHGSGGRGDEIIRYFKAEADRRGVILFAVDSADRTWDAVLDIGAGREPAFGEDAVRIDKALSEAFKRVAADPARIAVAGFSDGASYALSLGARNSGLFHTTLAFSAGMMVAGDTGPPGRIFMSHGESDRVLPIAVARDTLAPALRAAHFEVEFVSFKGGHDLPAEILARAFDYWLGPPHLIKS